jgi:hypothetical protein
MYAGCPALQTLIGPGFVANNCIGGIYSDCNNMAEVFAPFFVQGTMCNITFYVMEGRNFARKKSSLTRRKVLYSPQFKNTRHFAALMAKASKIGSLVFNALPQNWRQGWMYRSFTGEAFTMLKAGKKEDEIQQVLWTRYVELVVNKQPQETIAVPLLTPPKRAYRKLNSTYWKGKNIKSARRKARKEQTLYYAGLMAQASKIGSKLYARLPRTYAGRHHYQYLTGLALKLLKLELDEAEILRELLPTLPSAHRFNKTAASCEHKTIRKKAVCLVNHPKGQYQFIPIGRKRFIRKANVALPMVSLYSRCRFVENAPIPGFQSDF